MTMDQNKIDRINTLYHKSQSVGLTEEEKKELCRVVTESDAEYIKTSTGFSTGGATFEDVELMRKYTGADKMVKAAGGIKDFADAERFVELGADRLGTSRLVKIMKE